MNNDTNVNQYRQSFVDLTLEAWRFSQVFKNVMLKLTEDERPRYQGRYSWFRRKLEETLEPLGMSLVEMAPGTAYEAGMAVTPLNIGDFQSEDSLQIEQMIEPVIMENGSVIRTGTVILGRVEQ